MCARAVTLDVTDAYRDGFRATWDVEAETLRLCEIALVPEAYSVVKGWEFSWVESEKNSSQSVNISIFEQACSGLTGENLYIAANTSGMVQVGGGGNRGYLRIPAPPSDAEALMLRCFVKDTNSTHKAVVEILGGAAGVVSNEFPVTGEMADYGIRLGELPKSAMLQISPRAQDHPLQVASLRLVQDYAAEHIATNLVEAVGVANRRSKIFRSLHPGAYIWRLEDYDGEKGDGENGDGEYDDGENGDGEYGDGENGDGESGDGEYDDGEYASVVSEWFPITLSAEFPFAPTGFFISIR